MQYFWGFFPFEIALYIFLRSLFFFIFTENTKAVSVAV